MRPNPAFEPIHLGLTFFNVMNLVVTPAFMVWLCLALTKETSNRLDKAILILVVADYAVILTRTFSRLGYLPFYISPRISPWLFFIATVLLGYRMDQILKDQNKRIETIPCSTPS
jgi:hypothetical protein